MDVPNSYAFITANDTSRVCADLKLDIIENISAVSFITGDRPVAKYNQFFMDRRYYHSYGFGHVGFQMYCPISPQFCLLMYDPVPYNKHRYYGDKYVLNDPVEVHKINRLILGYADKEIYFGPQTSNRTIEKLVNKRETTPLSPSFRVYGNNDEYLLMKSEPSYWKNIRSKLLTTRKVFLEMPLPAHMGGPIRPYVERLERPS